MPITFACDCGTPISAPGASAGAHVQCPECGSLSRVPPRSDLQVDPTGAYAVRAVVAAGHAKRRRPPEPWHYGALACVAWIWAILGVGQFALAVLISLGGLRLGEGAGRAERPPALMASGVAMVGMLLSAGFVLLAVDVARNVRAIRWKS